MDLWDLLDQCSREDHEDLEGLDSQEDLLDQVGSKGNGRKVLLGLLKSKL